MWVYFNVPERQYLEYMAHRKQHEAEDKIELVLANGTSHSRKTASNSRSRANSTTRPGTSPSGRISRTRTACLRHGQTGTILIHRTLKNALVIPQRATFEILDKRYVWVVGEDDVAHQTLITIKHELEDIFVIDKRT